jgi:ATP-binding cassette subfamily B protein
MLLLRFYDPESGSIGWDGIDLRKVKRSSLRKRGILILQDTTLFNRSISENIAYSKPASSKKDIENAAKLAHAHEFILQLPNKYASIVGERGVRLSGGQRQRIAIARALLSKPDLLVMDEATSHLDAETERAIKEAIRYLHGKHTQVIIAHRLSTVQHADNIILMDKGRIVAEGSHKELLEHPLYRKLCKLQLQEN